ncbi:unnamed protein product [Blepharisma stoltei]|uniref:Uncharacterized protein n=1 Tax=Blepharisma stoltei TaxID=1481888 RepID=A0AAU9I9W2_9CILI|nr:unnamed protein product [Blepharisma stoltei]
MSSGNLRKIAEDKKAYLFKSINIFRNSFSTKLKEENLNQDSSFGPWFKEPPSKKSSQLRKKLEETNKSEPKPLIIYRRVNSNRVISVIRRREFDPLSIKELKQISLGERGHGVKDMKYNNEHQNVLNHKPSLSLSSGRSSSHRKLPKREFSKIFDQERNNETSADKNSKKVYFEYEIPRAVTAFNIDAGEMADNKANHSLLRYRVISNSLSTLDLKESEPKIAPERYQFLKKIANR